MSDPSPETPELLYEKQGPVAIITFNRPQKINCMGGEVYRLLELAAVDVAGDEAIRSVIVTGAGGNFSSGGDFAWYREQRVLAQSQGQVWQYDYPAHRAMKAIRKPVIAAIDGHCIAAGLSFAVLYCDIRIASDRAKLSFPAARRGLGGTGNQQAYPMNFTHYMGLGHVLYMMMTGEVLEASTALRMGIVNEVVPADQLLNRAMALAGRMADGSPEILAAYKEMFQRAYDVPGSDFQQLQNAILGRLSSSEYLMQSSNFLAKK